MMSTLGDLLNCELQEQLPESHWDDIAPEACPWCKGPMIKGDAEYLGTCGLCYISCMDQEKQYADSPAWLMPEHIRKQ